MRTIGNPEINNKMIVNRIQNVANFKAKTITLNDEFFSNSLNSSMEVLDVGQSLRDKFEMVSSKVKTIQTLDINVSGNYPDIQMDLCELIEIPADLNFDIIFCFSLLEHCYNPFIAAENLFKMLKPNSKIFGSAPFLFPHHCPEDLSYQDFFRFTKYSFISLFPNATRIDVSPHRGRVGAGLNIISQRYKDICEKSIPKLSKFINNIDLLRKPQQSSGFDFVVFN